MNRPFHGFLIFAGKSLNMDRIAVFPGSFDPVTKGHESVIRRSLNLFDKLIIALGENSMKTSLFTLEQRLAWLHQLFGNDERIFITHYNGLTVDFCREHGAQFILRGLRTSADFEFERAIAQLNKSQAGVESVFVISTPENAPVSSTILRDIIKNGGSVTNFVPAKVTV